MEAAPAALPPRSRTSKLFWKGSAETGHHVSGVPYIASAEEHIERDANMVLVCHESGILSKRGQRGDDNGSGFIWFGTREPHGSVRSIPGLQKSSGHGERNTRRDSRERLRLSG